MHMHIFSIGPLETNCYLLHNGQEAVVVDPGGPPDEILDYLRRNKLSLSHILLTHLHFDHAYGVRGLADATGAATLASENDRFLLNSESGKGGLWGMPVVPSYEFSPLEAGDLPLLGVVCAVLPTPGHTPGGMSFYFADAGAVFSGDSLFYRSVGRTDFPRSDHDTLLRSIRDNLFALPDDTAVYPGHGPATSVGDEKRNNPYASEFRTM